jgi:hypothetical protein
MKDPRDRPKREVDAELLKKKKQDKRRVINIRRKRKQKDYDRQT